MWYVNHYKMLEVLYNNLRFILTMWYVNGGYVDEGSEIYSVLY